MTKLMSFLCLRQSPPGNNEIRELTAQFYITLEAYFAKLKSAGAPRCQESYERIEQLLTEEHNWTNAYAIEQLLVHLFDDCTLASELQSRVREAKDTLRPALAEYYAAEAAKASQSADERRALLSRLVNDLQWRYTVNEVKRGYSKEITLKTGQLFILSLLVFAISIRLPDGSRTNICIFPFGSWRTLPHGAMSMALTAFARAKTPMKSGTTRQK